MGEGHVDLWKIKTFTSVNNKLVDLTFNIVSMNNEDVEKIIDYVGRYNNIYLSKKLLDLKLFLNDCTISTHIYSSIRKRDNSDNRYSKLAVLLNYMGIILI